MNASSARGSARWLGGRIDDDLSGIIELHGENVLRKHAPRIESIEKQGVRLDLLAQLADIVQMLPNLVLDGWRRAAFAARRVGEEHDIDLVEFGRLADRADVFACAVDRRTDFSDFSCRLGLFLVDLRSDDAVDGLRTLQAL